MDDSTDQGGRVNLLQKRLSWWLWLATLSFGIVAAWVVYEVRWFYPDLQRHFGPVGDPQVGRQIITRSREYLQNGLTILASEPLDEDQFADGYFQFELAYSFLNVGLYLERYDCTETSLNQLDQLLDRLTSAATTDLASVVRTVNPVIQCATSIEQHQWELRQTRALQMAERLDRSQRWFLTVTGIAYSMGVLFLVFYEFQRRRTDHSLKSQLSWMEKALEDALTGAQNRRAFDQDLQRHFERFRQGGDNRSLRGPPHRAAPRWYDLLRRASCSTLHGPRGRLGEYGLRGFGSLRAPDEAGPHRPRAPDPHPVVRCRPPLCDRTV